ncbi:DUF1482 family protein [Escherichia coli]|uniref:DUF1482 family protein n=1 Tax=Escherichia coli TaxID=562 RepID=UPI0012DE9106|nr:DUF1482 family protein [Escherichia coli]MUN32900.1 DUF1482 family protein [Escherichia coli]HAM4808650.1 DUF1482 family protein [Escherichia coli]HCQ8906468.1 DUF1482 family protein [Escherichia coli]HDD9007552.1 DUF1482 family protein [Escherichia coli]
MNTAFALVMTVFLITGESQNVITGIHESEASCLQARDEQKIPGNCYPVEKIIGRDKQEIPAGLKTAP